MNLFCKSKPVIFNPTWIDCFFLQIVEPVSRVAVFIIPCAACTLTDVPGPPALCHSVVRCWLYNDACRRKCAIILFVAREHIVTIKITHSVTVVSQRTMLMFCGHIVPWNVYENEAFGALFIMKEMQPMNYTWGAAPLPKPRNAIERVA